jgi:hypothetical protein
VRSLRIPRLANGSGQAGAAVCAVQGTCMPHGCVRMYDVGTRHMISQHQSESFACKTGSMVMAVDTYLRTCSSICVSWYTWLTLPPRVLRDVSC